MRPVRGKVIAGLAGLLAVGPLAGGCTLLRDEPADPPRAAGTVQPVPDDQWRPCPEVPKALIGGPAPNMTYECATISVPRDWARPDAPEKLELALIRIRSDEQEDRAGSLIVNPGGPGASGVDAAVYLSYGSMFAGLPDEVTRRFDIVGFDPRGVKRSSPIDCISDAQLDRTFGADPDPATREEFEATVALTEEIATGCGEKYGAALRYFSTEQTAHDLDAVREAVGDEKLTYLGYSYGTLLGAVYAHLHPTRVRAMVLDGAIDPQADLVASSKGQAEGFERAFDNFAKWCASTAECPLAPDARAAVTAAIDQARDEPATGEDGRKATAGWVFWAVVASLYSPERWPILAAAIDQLDGGDPTGVFDLADSYAERTPDGHYSNLFDANTAINCADSEADLTEAEVRDAQDEWREEHPLFGPPLAVGLLTCALWPVAKPDPYPAGAAEGAPPILVVGTTGDPATPYEQAPALADLLEVGVLLTVNGEGHTAYPGEACVDDAVNAYLIDLTVPSGGTTC